MSGADDVGGQQVGCELNAAECGVDAARQRQDGERFAESGNTFDEDVIAGEQGQHHAAQQVALPYNHRRELVFHRADPTD